LNIATAKKAPLWWDAVDASQTRPPLASDLDVDVLIVGAGFTGLWCAYHLAEMEPSASIAVIESTHVGFGASGRNGGWCHAEYPLGYESLVSDHGSEVALAHMRQLFGSVADVGAIADRENIDADFARGGVITMARRPFQVEFAREEVDNAHAFGLNDDDIRFLTKSEASHMIDVSDVLGGVWWAHGAAIQPAKLVHGLAAAAERRGVTIYEGTAATVLASGCVTTAGGDVRAPMIVRATEGYTSQLPGETRNIVPLYSLMVATEPIPPDMWRELGLADRQTFSDFRNLIIYGQRTADGRIAFGGRGAPYHYGSSISPEFDFDDQVHTELIRVLVELFPALSDYDITHRWGGPLGVRRDWKPSVSIDRSSGLAWAGGYVGDGVATAQLAGRTLAELIAGVDTERTALPWVNHTSRRWEPEPLRWIGINSGLQLASAADAREARTQQPSQLAALGNWVRGKG